jgi:hypothetical protein
MAEKDSERSWLMVNRAPVLTPWAVVAEVVGFEHDEVLALRRALAEISLMVQKHERKEMRRVRFLTLAQQELNDAVTWYNEQADGLGKELLDELDQAVRVTWVPPFLSSNATVTRVFYRFRLHPDPPWVCEVGHLPIEGGRFWFSASSWRMRICL